MRYCILGEECSVYDRRMQIPGICLTDPFCSGCRIRSTSELQSLRYDYVDLSQLVVPRDCPAEVRIFRPKPGSRPPLDMAVFTLREEIVHVVLLAEDAVRARFGDRSSASAGPVREGYALDRAVGYLGPRLSDLARLGVTGGWWHPREAVCVDLSGPQVLLLFGALHRRARRALGLRAAVVVLPGDCPDCGVPALRRRDDEPETIWCAACHTVMDRQRYLKSVNLQVPT